MKMVTFKSNKRLLEKYPAQTAKGMKMVRPNVLDIENPKSVYGGNMSFLAVIDTAGVALAITGQMQTLGVGIYNEENLDDEDREIFGLEVRKTMVSEEIAEEEITEVKQTVLTPSNETVKIVSNKINIPQKNNKRR